MKEEQADYGNWVSVRLIVKTLLAGMLFAALALIAAVAGPSPWLAGATVLCAAAALLSLAGCAYFLHARRLFSPAGGNVQERIVELLLSYVQWDGAGRALDIGCGGAALTVALAKKFPQARVTGVDYWGKSWDYGQQQCRRNAVLEGVGDRTDFLQASASRLPFPDHSFGLVVSNLTFHEVRDSQDKRQVLAEALRVVQPGGVFVFQDLFLLHRYYGTAEELVEAVWNRGAAEARLVDTSRAPFIPPALRLPFMVGTMAILYGVKQQHRSLF